MVSVLWLVMPICAFCVQGPADFQLQLKDYSVCAPPLAVTTSLMGCSPTRSPVIQLVSLYNLLSYGTAGTMAPILLGGPECLHSFQTIGARTSRQILS